VTVSLCKREEAIREAMGKLGHLKQAKREAIREAVSLGHSWGRIASLFGV
jgi:hypothetical protein